MMLKQRYSKFKASLSCKGHVIKKQGLGCSSVAEYLSALHKVLGLKGGKISLLGKKAIFWARGCLETLLSLKVPFFIGFLLLLVATVPLIEGPLVLDLWKLN